MRRTELSRPSFYVYFRDRHDLVLRVVEHIGGELFAMSERWYTGTGDGPALAREAIEGVVEVFAEHGPGAARAGRRGGRRSAGRGASTAALVQRFVDATARHIEDGDRGRARAAAGRRRDRAGARVDDGALPAAARSGARRTRRREPSPTTLTTIWSRVLYGDR